MDLLDKGMTYILGGTEGDSSRFHHAAQNGVQFNTYKFISGIFHLKFSDHSWPWVSETAESESADEGLLQPRHSTTEQLPQRP